MLTPPGYAERTGETSTSQTECLVEPKPDTVLRLRLRFLQLQRKSVEAAVGTGFKPVNDLTVDDRMLVPWDEGVPRQVDASIPFDAIGPDGYVVEFSQPGGESVEFVRDGDGRVRGRLVRRQWETTGHVRVSLSPTDGPYGTVRLRLVVANTSVDDAADDGRDGALCRSLLAAHTMLAVSPGSFVSLLDPPEWARPAVAGCVNLHTWPVLAGPEGDRDVVLSSPIILYDHPQVAPESPANLYDGTEIDEILSLRTLALTDEEKREARGTDPRAAAVIDGVDALPPEIFERLHGAIRTLRPAAEVAAEGAAAAAQLSAQPRPDGDRPAPDGLRIGPDGVPTFGTLPDGVPTLGTLPNGQPFGASVDLDADPATEYGSTDTSVPWWDPGADASVSPETDTLLVDGRPAGKGSRVVLHPSGRADAQDLFLRDQRATVHAVLHDVDGESYLAVSLDDDPAAELQLAHGRYRYFRPDEVELIDGGVDAPAGPGTVEREAVGGRGYGVKGILVAGVGNVFLSDDGFGVEVAGRLADMSLPEEVEVMDVGIRGVHLAYQLLNGYDALVLIDTTQRGGQPGTLYVIEPDLVSTADERPQPLDGPLVDAHGMEPDTVFALLGNMSRGAGVDPRAAVGRAVVVGCEPASIADGMGLGPEVTAAVDGAVRIVIELIEELLAEVEKGDGDGETADPRSGVAGGGSGSGPVAAGHRPVHADAGDVTTWSRGGPR